MFKVPSKKTLLFLGSVGSIVGAGSYDRHLSEQKRREIQELARAKALEPLGVHEAPRKLAVLLVAPPADGVHKARYYFDEYVKSIFDAAAMDYEIYEYKTPEQLTEAVAEDIKEFRRQRIHNKGPPAAKAEPGLSRDLRLLHPGGVAVLGRSAYVSYLKGLGQGLSGSLAPKQQEAEPASEEDGAVAKAAPSPPSPDYDALDSGAQPEIPPLGYVQFENLIGWRLFPLRVASWFNVRSRSEALGQEALTIALEHQRPCTRQDLSAGLGERGTFVPEEQTADVPDSLLQKLKIYHKL